MIRIGLNFLTWPKITIPTVLVTFSFYNTYHYAHVFNNYYNGNQHAVFYSEFLMYSNKITFFIAILSS